jgi:hypothetical protein
MSEASTLTIAARGRRVGPVRPTPQEHEDMR